VEHHPHRNYVMQWNLNVQRQLAPSLTAVVGYVGSHGVHQAFRADDGNIVLPTLTSAGYLWPNAVGDGKLINTNANVGAHPIPELAGKFPHTTHSKSGVKKQMSHGLQIQGSYTWGKSMDNNSGVIAGDNIWKWDRQPPVVRFEAEPCGVRLQCPPGAGRQCKLADPYDQICPHRFGLGRSMVGNSGGILKVSDGPPFTPTFGTGGGDPLGLNSTDPWAFPDRPVGSRLLIAGKPWESE